MLGVYVVVREQAMNISTPMMSCVTVVLCNTAKPMRCFVSE